MNDFRQCQLMGVSKIMDTKKRKNCKLNWLENIIPISFDDKMGEFATK